tara:strand:+ start:432 stop:869 length:438 start_codon:yes stop_codon:yes gene_type:complete
MLNRATLIGNLGREPEMKYTKDGKAIANLAIATSESWTDKNTQQKVERTEWHRVSIFGKLAETAGQYLHKGSKVYIEGKIQTRKWENKDGVTQYTTEIVLSGFDSVLKMLDKVGTQAPTHTPTVPVVTTPIAPVAQEEFDDDIPF